MAITMTGAGGLFTRVGQLGGALNNLQTYRGTTLASDIVDAIAQLDGGSFLLRDTMVSQLLGAIKQGQDALTSVALILKQSAQALLVKMVNDDNPQPSLDVQTALVELRRQMLVGAYYISPNTVSRTVTQTNLVGSPVVVAAIKDLEDLDAQNLIAQDIEIVPTDVTTPGSEQVLLLPQAGPSDPLDWLWPAGTSQSRGLTLIDAADGSSNFLANGGFESWTGSAMDSWSITTGAYGTDWVKEATTIYKGTYGAKLVGDGATLVALTQDITSKLTPFSKIAFNVFARRDGSAAAAGNLKLELIDGSGTVIKDEAGGDIQSGIDLTALTTSFVATNASFSLPRKLPSTVKFRIRLATALTNGRSVYLDHLALAKCEPSPLRAGWEPYVAIFSGNPDIDADDRTTVTAAGSNRAWRCAIANNRASGWCSLADKFWDTSAYELTLPFAGTTLINDNLIA